MTISRLSISLIVAGSFVLAACGDGDTAADRPLDDTTSSSTLPTPDDAADDAIDGDWILVAGAIDGVPVLLVDGWDVSLSIELGELGGTAACNGYGGFVDVSADGLRVTELSWTEMGCEPAVMQLEQSYLNALTEVTSWAVSDAGLTLTGPAIELMFETVAPVADTEIVGTTWTLDTTIEGDAASNSPLMGSAILLLNEDGTLAGSTGCRLLEGEWTTTGAEVVFTSFSAIDDPLAGVCSPESERLDGFVIGVLEGGFTAVVDGSRLTITARGGEGLSYMSG
jgi:heat shock protein HslJ